MRYKRVGVLFGGSSAERDVSLASGRAVATGLKEAGYDVVEIDVGRALDKQLRESAVEAVFVALHGKRGEDGTVQGMLEMMGIPYTGSPVTPSAIAMDKQLTRDLLTGAGLPVPQGCVLKNREMRLPEGFALPVVIKPVAEGSSVGVSIAKTDAELRRGFETAYASSHRILVESFVSGTEIQVAVMDGVAIGAVEIEPNREFYDYEAKYTAGGANHYVPPRIEKRLVDHCIRLATQAFDTLACAGLARIDLIAPADRTPVILEVNTSPGMTEFSLCPEIAAHAGIPFSAFVDKIMQGARLHVE